jgi:hypothetical protein
MKLSSNPNASSKCRFSRLKSPEHRRIVVCSKVRDFTDSYTGRDFEGVVVRDIRYGRSGSVVGGGGEGVHAGVGGGAGVRMPVFEGVEGEESLGRSREVVGTRTGFVRDNAFLDKGLLSVVTLPLEDFLDERVLDGVVAALDLRKVGGFMSSARSWESISGGC